MSSNSAARETIGFVGAGLMGHGIAANLLAGGYPLTVVGHRNRGPIDDLVGRGAREAASVAEMAAGCSVIFLCLTDARAVEAVVGEMDGVVKRGAVIVDCSTSDPVVTTRLAERLAARGVDYCDAPVGGTPDQAEAGQLQAMVGANPEVFSRLQPVLETWTARIVHVGRVGDGHRMKLLNNFIALGYGALYAEALAVARKSGLTVQQVDQVIRGGRMDCGFYRTFMGYALEGNHEAHKFTLQNAYKDMRYVGAMADAAGCANPLTSAIKNSYAMAVGTGGDGQEDYVPELVDYVARANGLAD